MIDLSKSYSDPEIIFHYTSLETLVNFILPEEKLKFRKRIEQEDYFERTYLSPVWYLNHDQADSQTLESVDIKTRNRFKNVSQISFCKSGYSDSMKWEPNKSYDGYGFLKHRMWDNYGNRNKGVCLAFNRKKIVDKLSELNVENYWFRDVDYKKNDEIEKIIKPRSTQKLTDSEINTAHEDYLKYLLFLKNIDFRDENEFRICVESEEKNTFLPIQGVLKAVFFSEMRKENILKSERILFQNTLKESKEKDFEVYVINPFSSQIQIY